MECPYCKGEMRQGALSAPGSQMGWCPNGEDGKPLSSDWEGRVPLTKAPIFKFDDYYVPAFYCPACRRIILDVPEIESRTAALRRKWNGFTEKAARKRAALEAERAEKTRERRSAERRKKDPWEVD